MVSPSCQVMNPNFLLRTIYLMLHVNSTRTARFISVASVPIRLERTIGISQLPRREPKLYPENNISYVAQNMCIQLEFVMK